MSNLKPMAMLGAAMSVLAGQMSSAKAAMSTITSHLPEMALETATKGHRFNRTHLPKGISHTRRMTEDEIGRLAPLDLRPAFGPVRYANGQSMGRIEIPIGLRTCVAKRTRYMPHIGAKERARHAGRPDGPMHTPVGGLV